MVRDLPRGGRDQNNFSPFRLFRGSGFPPRCGAWQPVSAITSIVVGGLVPLAISHVAVEQHMGFAVPMLIGTVAGSVSVILALLFSPETKGKVFVAELMKH